MSPLDFAEFALAVLLLEITPGPNMAWLAALGATEPRPVALAAVVGVAVGLTLNALLAAMGVAALIMAEPSWQYGLRVTGAALMLWLGWSTWREADTPITAERRRFAGAGGNFAAGTLLNLINPKSILFFVAIVPPFLHGHNPTLGLAMALASVSVGIATAIHLGIVIGAGQAQDWLARSGYVRRLKRAMAVLMVALGVWLAVSLLR